MSASILDNLDSVAVVAGGFFAGTSLYVTIGEIPAIRAMGVDVHWRFFPYMYERAVVSQATFATIAGVAGIVHGTRIIGSVYDRNLWIIAGSIFVGTLPYTLICMLPTNKLIVNDSKRVTAGNESQLRETTRKETLDKWAALHLVRTVGSAIGFGLMAYGLSRHSSLILGW